MNCSSLPVCFLECCHLLNRNRTNADLEALSAISPRIHHIQVSIICVSYHIPCRFVGQLEFNGNLRKAERPRTAKTHIQLNDRLAGCRTEIVVAECLSVPEFFICSKVSKIMSRGQMQFYVESKTFRMVLAAEAFTSILCLV